MSAMMATSASGPVPVAPQTQFAQPQSVTMTRGHQRQPSSAARSTTQGDPNARTPHSPSAAAINSPKNTARVVGSGSGTSPRVVIGGATTTGPRIHGSSTSQQQRPQTSYGPGQNASAGPSGTQRIQQQHQQQPQTQSFRPTSSRQTEPVAQPQPQPAQAHPSTAGNPGSSAQQSQPTARNSSFPHAFERWEMLSSRWEGLTGYWVSRLEGNRSELSHLPLEQEMSRQITDLAAAGANLFQALIELQRLRASSERKFQRWFFETRADQERAREMSSELERTLRVERQKRAEAVTQIQQLEKDKANAEKLAQETQRELQISKEECRRAWEELGKREQEERETTTRLRDGHPTLVGGFQVTPMPMPGVPSRSNSTTRPRTATGPAAGQPAGPTEQSFSAPRAPSPPRAQDSPPTVPKQTLHHEGDLIDLQQRPVPPTSTVAATGATPTQQGTPSPSYPPLEPSVQSPQITDFYLQAPTPIQGRESSPSGAQTPVSYGTNPDIGSPAISGVSGVSNAFETDEHGSIVVDERGQPVYARRRSDKSADEFAEREWEPYPDYDGAGYGRGQPPSGYSGGVGIGSGWEAVPRHHHPTRLSDVLEEDERATNSDRQSLR